MAELDAADIDYINLHGTATPSNDAAEAKAVAALFGSTTPCSSTKGATGHTLGASGALEAVICALALQHGLLPGGLNTQQPDPALALNYLLKQPRASRDPGAEQLLRFWRHQLQPDFWPCRLRPNDDTDFCLAGAAPHGLRRRHRLAGPGLSNWAQGRGALEGTETYQAARCIVPLPLALPAAERRRAGTVVKVALASARRR